MSEVLAPGPIGSISQFFQSPPGVWRGGACGICAETIARAVSDQVAPTMSAEVAVYQKAAARGLITNPNGARYLWQIADNLRADGYPVIRQHNYSGAEPLGEAYDVLNDPAYYAVPIVVQTAYGSAFRDYLSGKGENTGGVLYYHFVTRLGRHTGGYSARARRNLPSGHWFGDGDNFNAPNIVFYPDDVVAAAKLCAYCVVGIRAHVNTSGGGANGGGSVGVPGGWFDDGSKLWRPDRKFYFDMGFRDRVLNESHDPANVPLEDAHGFGGDGSTEQVCSHTVYRWHPGPNGGTIEVLNAGDVLLAERAARANTPPPPPQTIMVTVHEPSPEQQALIDAAKAYAVAQTALITTATAVK